jgi:hypothetical protein
VLTDMRHDIDDVFGHIRADCGKAFVYRSRASRFRTSFASLKSERS